MKLIFAAGSVAAVAALGLAAPASAATADAACFGQVHKTVNAATRGTPMSASSSRLSAAAKEKNAAARARC